MSQLSAYKLMWLMTLFDLPVTTKAERKAATGFRHFLLDQGFEMAQYSVYMRLCSGKEQAETYCRRIRENMPDGGRIDIITITDKQYENIVSFVGKVRQTRKNPEQYSLF
ncbi:MAG: CRISPR-associated endonuclease Cas2 [Candidatus Thiodiazotropha sp.]